MADPAPPASPSSSESETRARVEHVAELAALSLDEDEIEVLGRDFAAVLTYVERLRAVDTAGIEPTTSVLAEPAPARDDTVLASLTNAEATGQAPRTAGEEGGLGFTVPVFVES